MYTTDYLESMVELNESFNNIIIMKAELESVYIKESVETNHINPVELMILEEGFGDAIRSFIQKIKDFFKRIFGDYEAKSKSKSQNYKLLIKNAKEDKKNPIDILKIKITDESIESPPYWKGDGKITEAITIVSSTRDKYINGLLAGGTTREKMLSNFKSQDKIIEFVKFYTKDGDLTEGFKNYFRVGDANGDISNVRVSGQELAKLFVNMHQYCDGYLTSVVNPLAQEHNKLQASLTKVENSIKRLEKTAENFSILENATYKETILPFIENFQFLLEAETEVKTDVEKKEDSKPADDKDNKKVEKPKVFKSEDQSKDKDESTSLDDLSSDQLNLIKRILDDSKLTLTTAMTIGEEKFVAYVSIITGIINAKKSKGK